ncbi:MAG: alpha/beta-type small acid-soluble spore protein [Bacillota bacterium]
MGRRRNSERLVPGAGPALDRFKYEVAQELGLISATQANEPGFARAMDHYKYEVAGELGLLDKLQAVGWGNMTSRECGAVGGRLGGKIGGQMVKRMIEFAEANMR